MAEHVLLVGMMASGKTTIGRLLGERLGRPYVDSDEQVEAATGRTVREIFESDGEQAFRQEESAALRAAARAVEPSVIAVAGGAVLDPANREVVESAGTVVWLRARLDTLAGRIGSGNHRPLLDPDPAETLRRLYGEREQLYAALADVVVDVDEAGPDEIVDRVLAAL